jgi:hypothetical protein
LDHLNLRNLLGLIASILVLQLFSLNTFAKTDCDFVIYRVMVPLKNKVDTNPICLNEYFQLRDLGQFSYIDNSKGKIVSYQDKQSIQLEDIILFEVSEKLLGIKGRLKYIKEIYKKLNGSIKNDFGLCHVNLMDDDKTLSINDFILTAREEGDHPGSRLMLTNDDIKNPHWELICTNSMGIQKIVKKGTYVFIFIDIYENIGTKTIFSHHMAKYLFHLKQ